jgi:hypothetical protein
MRIAAVALLGLALSGCGSGQDGTAPVTENQIERLSRPAEVVVDRLASVRVQPLTDADAAGAAAGAQCRFTRNGKLVLLASGEGAIARVAGELRQLEGTGPASPSGGFYEDNRTSISVGRTTGAAAPASEGGPWPGRIAVTNRRDSVRLELRGTWTCAG